MSNQELSHYLPPEALKEEEIIRRITERGPEGEILGGIVYEEETDPETQEVKRYIYIGNPYEEKPTVTKLETNATEEEINAIKREIIPLPESFRILEAIARTYRLRQPLLIEGPTAIGKTYLVGKFTELLYGRGVKPLDFYCSGQTDVSELMARWVPKVETEEEKRKWNEFLESVENQAELSKIAQEVEEKQGLSQEQKLALIRMRLAELAKRAGFSERTQWRLQYGAVPKAMGLIRNPDGSFSFDEQRGMGFILHIEEVGLAEPQVINALLKLRGERGQLAEEIQLWENGGRKIKAGPQFWVVFSTNPPEEYLARNEVDPALARGVVFLRMGDLSFESLRLAAEYYFTYKIKEKPKEKPEGCILDIYNHPEIGRAIAEVVSSFHNNLNEELKRGEKGRQQRIPLTLDDMARVADGLLFYQIRDRETGLLDLSETLIRLIEFYYLERLADEELKETMKKALEETIYGDTGKVKFEGKEITRKELFDILVKRASLPNEELEKEAQRLLRQAEYSTKDEINELINNPNIPDELREELRKIADSL